MASIRKNYCEQMQSLLQSAAAYYIEHLGGALAILSKRQPFLVQGENARQAIPLNDLLTISAL